MATKSTKTDELAENSPFNVTAERKGRGRKQGNAIFVRSINSSDLPELTPEQRRQMQEFYQLSHAQEAQYVYMAREWGCYR